MELTLSAHHYRFVKPDDVSAEATIVDRCRKRDVEAFGRFVDLYQARVFGFVKRMLPSVEDASDVTQEVFIKAFQSFDRFDGRSSVRTWLFRIAHNLCIDRARKSARSFSEVGLVDSEDGEFIDVPDERWQPDQLFADQELMTLVERAIGSMSDKLRSVLLLHDREDMAYEDIAETLNVPIGTVKSRLFLARAHLQQAVRGYLSEGATS